MEAAGQADSPMAPVPPPLAFVLLLFSGWVNRHPQRSLTICSRKIESSGRRTVRDDYASPTTTDGVSP
jgi:hypothetical protein